MNRCWWFTALVCFAFSPPPALGQECVMSAAGLNRARSAFGAIHAECGGDGHSAPFGNWGATSNYGKRRDGHQFDGWCQNRFVCDNWGYCKMVCTDGWSEWNSCTDDSRYAPPNCSLYNAENCTRQESTTDANVLGTVYVRARTTCPIDTNGDGICDSGGCKDIASVTASSNYMTLYELDPFCCNTLVQSVYFPATTVQMNCTPWGCTAAGSDWVAPTSYDSPSWPPKVRAELALAVNWASFSDPNRWCAYYARFDPRYNCR